MSLEELVNLVQSNPGVVVVVLVQFALGVALGYFSAKVVKYILAIIATLFAGTILSVWTSNITLEELVQALTTLSEPAKRIVTAIGLFTMGPITAGFVVGVLIALARG